MRYVVIVAFLINHFAGLVGVVVNEFIGRVVVGHYRVVAVVGYAVIVPYLHYA